MGPSAELPRNSEPSSPAILCFLLSGLLKRVFCLLFIYFWLISAGNMSYKKSSRLENFLEASEWGSNRVQVYTQSVTSWSGLLTLVVRIASEWLSQSLQPEMSPGSHLSLSTRTAYFLVTCISRRKVSHLELSFRARWAGRCGQLRGRGREVSFFCYSLIFQLNSRFCSKL